MPAALLFSGSELVAPSLPDDAVVLMPPPAQPGIEDVRAAVAHALEHPVDGKPLSELVWAKDRVVVAFDSPAFPAPPMRIDPRTPAMEAILSALAGRGLKLDQVTLVCAAGVGRIYRNTEIAQIVGVTPAASHPTLCHDAEDPDGLAKIGDTTSGEPVEVNAALARADLVVSLSLVQAPLNGGWTTVAAGLASAATARRIFSARNLCEGPNLFDAEGSRAQRALKRAGEVIESKVKVLHVELAVGTRLWPAPLQMLLRRENGLSTTLAAWNRVPGALRDRVGRLFRGENEVVCAVAGSTGAAHARALELAAPRWYVPLDRPADVVVLGAPAVGPYTLASHDNPVLAASLALGHMLAWHRGKPAVRPGGAVVLLAPLAERFDRKTHLPYVEFYERALAAERDPFALADRFEAEFAGRAEFVAAYRRRHAFHGFHPFFSWSLAASALAQVGKVVAVGASERAAARLGFARAASFEEGLLSAREFAGGRTASVAVLGMPPPFGVTVAG